VNYGSSDAVINAKCVIWLYVLWVLSKHRQQGQVTAPVVYGSTDAWCPSTTVLGDGSMWVKINIDFQTMNTGNVRQGLISNKHQKLLCYWWYRTGVILCMLSDRRGSVNKLSLTFCYRGKGRRLCHEAYKGSRGLAPIILNLCAR
jgi:hypothetical protein